MSIKNIMKNIKLIIITIVISITYSCKAQQISGVQQQITIYNNEIIGTWVSNNDPTYKRVFTNNGTGKICKDYSNGELTSTYTYTIATSCGEENAQGFIYLKLVDEDSDEYCFEINGINENNSNILSLTGLMRGKIQLYTKE